MSVTAWAGSPIPEDVWTAVIDIYREAFPASERMDEAALRGSIESGRRSLWMLDRDAFAIALDLRTASPWIFGEYLAVRADARSGGLGGTLLAALHAVGRPVVLEVEDPEWAGELAARRIAFYERFGARRVPGTAGFVAPDLATPGSSVPMWLLALPVGDDASLADPAIGHRLARAIWTEGYGLAEGSAELEQLAARLHDGNAF